jgi:tetrahydromethanopterin S-methyltransferase subunit G
VGFFVRSALNEQKRIDILLNKTREELAKEYVSKDEFQQAMDRLMISIERIDEKLDRLQSRTYFQE